MSKVIRSKQQQKYQQHHEVYFKRAVAVGQRNNNTVFEATKSRQSHEMNSFQNRKNNKIPARVTN